MPQSEYADSFTMLQARTQYFEDNAFGPNGGYDDAWVDFRLGGKIPMPFPNTQARVRAVRYHDLHHILTGYHTDNKGEFEISAWEIGAGCKQFVAAWQLNLGGVCAGCLVAPRRTFRAFVRGRRSQSLYGRDLPQLLDKRVGELRRETGVDAPAQTTASDVALFALAAVGGLVAGTVSFVLFVPLAPFAIAAGALRKKPAPRVPAQ